MAALRQNFAAFSSDLKGNQIQGETLPRLSQAGEGFLPEFDFQLKIVKKWGVIEPTTLPGKGRQRGGRVLKLRGRRKRRRRGSILQTPRALQQPPAGIIDFSPFLQHARRLRRAFSF